MKTVMVIYGTRPEAIKVAPLVSALADSRELQPYLVTTGQHRSMLDQVNEWFGLKPAIDLDLFSPGTGLNRLAARVIDQVDTVLEEVRPDVVVVQGDTTTVSSAALAAFYRQIPVVHLEAGLRSGDIMSPFPEEANRRIAGQLAALHLAPTQHAKQNLLREGHEEAKVTVVGNTVIDALNWTASRHVDFSEPRLERDFAADRPMILLTTHRRENWGAPMRSIGRAVRRLAEMFPDHTVVFPAHANPLVMEDVGSTVAGLPNVVVCSPLSYPEFVKAMKWATLILSDSGGVQEEAPALGTPVLVLRENTERPEAVAAGTVKLVGTDEDRLVHEASLLLTDTEAWSRMSRAMNPYGDGRASERAVAAIEELLNVGQRLPEFEAGH